MERSREISTTHRPDPVRKRGFAVSWLVTSPAGTAERFFALPALEIQPLSAQEFLLDVTPAGKAHTCWWQHGLVSLRLSSTAEAAAGALCRALCGSGPVPRQAQVHPPVSAPMHPWVRPHPNASCTTRVTLLSLCSLPPHPRPPVSRPLCPCLMPPPPRALAPLPAFVHRIRPRRLPYQDRTRVRSSRRASSGRRSTRALCS